MNLKGCGRKQLWANLMYSPGIYLEGLRKITKALSHDTQSLARDLIWNLTNMKQKWYPLDHNLQSVETNVEHLMHI
jgi:hypothetical protein